MKAMKLQRVMEKEVQRVKEKEVERVKEKEVQTVEQGGIPSEGGKKENLSEIHYCSSV